ncbi:Contactin-associated protein-like 5 [Liparis tanakae]|uniref:Contactin-associated protein-like 5 n=1 Tax=Liparis tanakae TaxID=230148 RepID=A0A4Z2H676_9TELE|nr:Contactin-associated protein-like 5 [Liparis tanakae]
MESRWDRLPRGRWGRITIQSQRAVIAARGPEGTASSNGTSADTVTGGRELYGEGNEVDTLTGCMKTDRQLEGDRVGSEFDQNIGSSNIRAIREDSVRPSETEPRLGSCDGNPHTTASTLSSTGGQRVNDGLWHSVGLHTGNRQISLTLDGEASAAIELWAPLAAGGSVNFGGCPPADCQSPTPDFQGCVRLIFLNGQPVNLNRVQQGLLGTHSELRFDTCDIRDR